jgi:hypothetical protein
VRDGPGDATYRGGAQRGGHARRRPPAAVKVDHPRFYFLVIREVRDDRCSIIGTWTS